MDKTQTDELLIINILKVHIICMAGMMWTIYLLKTKIIPALRIFFLSVSRILQGILWDIPDE